MVESFQFQVAECLTKSLITRAIIWIQQFQPGYTAPPKLFLYGTTPMNFRYSLWSFFTKMQWIFGFQMILRLKYDPFRGNWEISRRDIHNHQYITMTQTDRAFLASSYYDHAASNARSIMYCRIVAATVSCFSFLLWNSNSYLWGSSWKLESSVSSSWLFWFFTILSHLSRVELSSIRSRFSQ